MLCGSKRIPISDESQARYGYTFVGPTARLTCMTVVAWRCRGPITSTGVAPEPMKHRNFRLDDSTWKAASRIAELRGERISDAMRELVRGYVRRHKKLLDSDPVWQAELRGEDAS